MTKKKHSFSNKKKIEEKNFKYIIFSIDIIRKNINNVNDKNELQKQLTNKIKLTNHSLIEFNS